MKHVFIINPTAGKSDSRQKIYDMAEKLRQEADFTAVFSIADNMALGAMRALREAGRRVPEDCSVIAIDGLTMSEYFHPMLTTLCQPMGGDGAVQRGDFDGHDPRPGTAPLRDGADRAAPGSVCAADQLSFPIPRDVKNNK